MNKTTLLLLVFVVLFVGVVGFVFFPGSTKTSLVSPFANSVAQKSKAQPSETLKEYSDQTGFTISYPDNLSIESKEIEDNSTYADIQLNSKDVSGSIRLTIADTKLTSIDEWVKKNATSQTPTETKLGSLNAKEIKFSDRLLLVALDQGILFTIEMPLVEQDFWSKVYSQIIKDFTFTSPTADTKSGQAEPTSDISFEGEEVVE